MNYPNSWVILKITGPETENKDPTVYAYKVLAGWSGSYLNGSSWQLNSGIVDVEEDKEHFLFSSHSGSVYICHKDTYGISMATAEVWNTLQTRYPGQVELMPENTDWSKLIMEKV
jgi:hypothetical protein